MDRDRRSFVTKTLGPGLLFCGAAVGVSHLVQSTRAGAVYGAGLVLVIIAANIVKYPAFSFGPRYAAATGTSLLEGYRRQGIGALLLYALLTLGTMFAVQAVVTVVTAGLAQHLFDLDLDVAWISAGLLAACAAILVVGRYRWLDMVIKVAVAALTITTVLATILALPRLDWAGLRPWPAAGQWDLETAAFVAALVGWMPSALDISVWHSLWTLAKRRDTRHAPTVRAAMLDFDIGYYGTAVLAVCFMLLGAAVLWGAGEPMAGAAGPFAAQVIGLYTATLGDWSRYVIGGAALLVMFSTTLTVVDGFPRALSALVARFRAPEQPGAGTDARADRAAYWGSMAVLAAGAVLILRYLAPGDFKRLVDVATTLSFLTAPALAILNHRSVFAAEVPEGLRPGEGMRRFSLICIVLLSAFAAWWVYLRFL